MHREPGPNGQLSDCHGFDAQTNCTGEMLYVVRITGDDYIAADCGAHRYRGVDHIGSLG